MQFEHLVTLGPFFSALATSFLALLTVFAVRASRAMAREMYETRLAQFRPVLYPTICYEGGAARLHLRNVGPGAAMDIDVSCKGDFDREYHLPFFGPGEKIDLPLADPCNRRGEVRIKVRYRDLFGNLVEIEGHYRRAMDGDGYVFPFETVMRGGLHSGENVD